MTAGLRSRSRSASGQIGVMTYTVKEIFKTLQGEGANIGRTAVFCRFAGCNLWTGREEDRASATCTFCDTDFVGTDGSGGGNFEAAEELVASDYGWLGVSRSRTDSSSSQAENPCCKWMKS